MSDESFLSVLLGKSCSIEQGSDYLQIRVENGWTLAIFSAYKLHRRSPQVDVDVVESKQILLDAKIAEMQLELSFSDGITLTVDLSADGYMGPEAMVLSGPGAEMVVWN